VAAPCRVSKPDIQSKFKGVSAIIPRSLSQRENEVAIILIKKTKYGGMETIIKHWRNDNPDAELKP
jgi:hypothetical protein